MSVLSALIILVTTLVTSFISGIFGMAGGLILMGVLVMLVSVAPAMIIHGLIQMLANGYRTILLRHATDWRVFGYYCIGAAGSMVVILGINWIPDKQALYLMLGLMAVLVWVPKSWFCHDIRRPGHAVLAGFGVQGTNTIAGVAGPLLDLFFIHTDMSRQQIVATKSAVQCLGHAFKVSFWSTAAGWSSMPPWWLIAAAIPLTIMGTSLGRAVLERMDDGGFRIWTKGLVTVTGAIFLIRAGMMAAG